MKLTRAETIKQIYEELNKSNFDVIDTYVHDNFQLFIPSRGSLGQGKSIGSVEWKSMLNMGKISFPETIYTIEDLIDDQKSKIVVRGRKKAKHTGSTPFVEATNEEIDIPFFKIYEFDESGKIINSWALEDELSSWLKIGMAKVEFKSPKTEIKSNVFTSNDTFPRSPQALTNEWFSTIFKSNVKLFTIQNNIGESQQGYAGETIRVTLEFEQPSDNLPKTIIVKFSSQNQVTKNALNSMKTFHREAFFYKYIAPKVTGITLAHCYFVEIDDPSGDHIILLQDLSEKGMEAGDLVKGVGVEKAKIVLENLAKFHAQFWDNPVPNSEWLTQDYLLNIFKGIIKHSYEFAKPVFLKYNPNISQKFVEYLEKIDPEALYEKLGNRTKHNSYCHIDTHLNNMLFSKDPNKNDFVLIDWQFTVTGLTVRDVTQFLSLCLQEEYFKTHLAELKQHYFDTLKENAREGSSLLEYSKENFEEDFKKSAAVSFLGAVSMSTKTVQKTEDDDPKIKRIYEICAIAQKRTIQLVETEGLDYIFGN